MVHFGPKLPTTALAPSLNPTLHSFISLPTPPAANTASCGPLDNKFENKKNQTSNQTIKSHPQPHKSPPHQLWNPHPPLPPQHKPCPGLAPTNIGSGLGLSRTKLNDPASTTSPPIPLFSPYKPPSPTAPSSTVVHTPGTFWGMGR